MASACGDGVHYVGSVFVARQQRLLSLFGDEGVDGYGDLFWTHPWRLHVAPPRRPVGALNWPHFNQHAGTAAAPRPDAEPTLPTWKREQLNDPDQLSAPKPGNPVLCTRGEALAIHRSAIAFAWCPERRLNVRITTA